MSRSHRPSRRKTLAALLGLGGLLALAAVAIWFFAWPRASLQPSAKGLARIDLSGAGERLISAQASYDAHKVTLLDHSGRLVPGTGVPVDTVLTVTVKLARPSWISWLAGSSARLTEKVKTPFARLLDPVAIARPGQPVLARFSTAVSVISVNTSGTDPSEHLSSPSTNVKIIAQVANGQSGTAEVSGAPHSWETLPPPADLIYFGTAGHTPIAILTPQLSSSPIAISSNIALTLSEPVAKAFGGKDPTITPVIPGALVPKGTWSEPTPYSVQFTPKGPQFWPGEQMRLELPEPVRISSGQSASQPLSSITFEGDPGSVLRLQQMLASLGYLPLGWSGAVNTTASTSLAAEASYVSAPPQGSFSWKWTLPSALTSLWQPGVDTVITRGAVMTFEKVEGLNTTGQANPLLWPTLIQAVMDHKADPYPYTWMQVSMQLPERLWLWSNGQVVLTTLANTGIPQDPTAPGTYPVYLRLPFQIMRGTNPNGSSYADPVHWINYFNGSDAVHGFLRAAYGFPQSLGCVELPIAVAAQVFPQVHIGTLVTVMP